MLDSPNMVCTINHAMEDLHEKLLIIQIWSIMPLISVNMKREEKLEGAIHIHASLLKF